MVFFTEIFRILQSKSHILVFHLFLSKSSKFDQFMTVCYEDIKFQLSYHSYSTAIHRWHLAAVLNEHQVAPSGTQAGIQAGATPVSVMREHHSYRIWHQLRYTCKLITLLDWRPVFVISGQGIGKKFLSDSYTFSIDNTCAGNKMHCKAIVW